MGPASGEAACVTGDEAGDATGDGCGPSGDATRASESAAAITAAPEARAETRRKPIGDRFTTKRSSLKRVFSLAVCLAVAAACDRGASTQVGAGAPRPIELLVPNDPDTLDPRYVTDTVGMRTTRLLHAGLTRLDPTTLRPVPYLAARLVWADPRTLDVTLREGMRFHSGAPLGAEDVVATLRALASPRVASRHASTVEPILSVDATGPLTVRIVLRRPHATLLSDLDLPILRRDQAEAPPDPSGASLDGLGPFTLERFTRGEVLLRPAATSPLGPAIAPGPSDGRPGVAIRTVHDENARAIRLYSGHADLAMNGISPTLLPALDGHAGLIVATSPGANLTYLVARVDRGPLADVRLRTAISLAIDRRTITESLFGHRATAAAGLLPDGHWAGAAGLVPFPFDPKGARAALLAIGGATPPAVRLTLLTSTDRLRITVARTMAQELGDVGLDVEVVPLELGTLIARLNAGDFDLASLQLPELTEPNVLRVFLHGAFIPPAGSNRGRVRDTELDTLLDEGDATPDDDARARVYAALERRMREQLFVIPLWHEDQVAVVGPRARGFRPSPDGRWLSLATLHPGD